MDYTKKNPPDANEGAAEVREPAVAYAYAPAGAVAGADWEDDLDDDYDAKASGGDVCDQFERMLKENAVFREAFIRELEEAAAEPGGYTTEELSHYLWREIKERVRAGIAAGRIPPQPKSYWDELEQKIENSRL